MSGDHTASERPLSGAHSASGRLPPADRLRALRRLLKSEPETALEGLRRLLAERSLDPLDHAAVGRLLRARLAAVPDPRGVRLGVAGQCTTHWLCDHLVAWAFAEGTSLHIEEADYDAVMQAVLGVEGDPSAATLGAPSAMVLLPWTQRLLGKPAQTTPPACRPTGDRAAVERPLAERVADELGFWQQAIARLQGTGTGVVLVGYDLPDAGAEGYHLGGRAGGACEAVRALNTALRQSLPPGGYFVDLERVAGDLGRAQFYSPRQYHWAKEPFSEAGAMHLAHHLWAGLRAQRTGPKKVLVLDLDNTLWGGVVGETGPLGIALGDTPEGEAYRAFQHVCRQLARRGVLLAVASKNNLEDARQPFRENPDMVLALDDLVAFHANWLPKSQSLRAIAAELNVGLDSLVFFDDNPAERAEVRSALPEVLVIEVPEEPALYVRALAESLAFETLGLTSEDAERSRQYAEARERVALQAEFSTFAEYLDSLQMVGRVEPVTETSLQRVVQLIGKTNQWNLTTRRYNEAQVRAVLAAPGTIARTLRLADRFGDSGLVAVALLVHVEGEPSTARLDVLLMSCRVINRTAEDFFLRHVFRAAREAGLEHVMGEYLPTPKNILVREFFDRYGGTCEVEPDGRRVYRLDLDVALGRAQTHVRDGAAAADAPDSPDAG